MFRKDPLPEILPCPLCKVIGIFQQMPLKEILTGMMIEGFFTGLLYPAPKLTELPCPFPRRFQNAYTLLEVKSLNDRFHCLSLSRSSCLAQNRTNIRCLI
jgi:hypothetical protein